MKELPYNVYAQEALATEAANPEMAEIDMMDTQGRLAAMNAQDMCVAAAVRQEIPHIARAVNRAAHSLRVGGRLLYVGAGTSGRLGVLDASECPPTFGTPPRCVQGIIAGGEEAMFRAVEGAEDDAELGAAAMVEADVCEQDTVVGITASGRTPFVVSALRQARRRAAATISLAGSRPSEIEAFADIVIAPLVGPEVLAGSTRLKNGTAQKMVLNMISTGAMIEVGKTYGNLMVDVRATNTKLRARAARIVSEVTGASQKEAEQALAECDGSSKLAIVFLATGRSPEASRQLLEQSGGFLRRALCQGGSPI